LSVKCNSQNIKEVSAAPASAQKEGQTRKFGFGTLAQKLHGTANPIVLDNIFYSALIHPKNLTLNN